MKRRDFLKGALIGAGVAAAGAMGLRLPEEAPEAVVGTDASLQFKDGDECIDLSQFGTVSHDPGVSASSEKYLLPPKGEYTFTAQYDSGFDHFFRGPISRGYEVTLVGDWRDAVETGEAISFGCDGVFESSGIVDGVSYSVLDNQTHVTARGMFYPKRNDA